MLACAAAILAYVVPKMEGELMLNPQTAWPLWPGCAILVAALMLVPTKIWPILIPASFAGFVLCDLQAGVPVSSIAWFIPADTIQVLTAALGLRYCFEGVPRFNNINA
jgi:integral membrane sensor domain MASE1